MATCIIPYLALQYVTVWINHPEMGHMDKTLYHCMLFYTVYNFFFTKFT